MRNNKQGSENKKDFLKLKTHPPERVRNFIASAAVCIFLAFLIFIFILSFTIIQSKVNISISIPRSLEDLKKLNAELTVIQQENYYTVLLFFCSLYILKQTFCIPGSLWLNLWGGSMFGLFAGFPLCCFLTTFGAGCCYWVSHLIFRGLVERFFYKKIQMLSLKIQKEAPNNLVWYLLFLRVVPFTPNWLLNLASPILGIPFKLFVISIFFGLIPYNFIAVQTGTILTDLSASDDIFDKWTIIKLLSIACIYLALILGKNYLSKINSNVHNNTDSNNNSIYNAIDDIKATIHTP